MAIETKQVALYGVHFKGVFGRNRSPKFKANRDLVELPQGVDELEFCAQLADKFAAEIKPKDGVLRVVVYRKGEITRYTGADGMNGNDYTMHLYQPYDAVQLTRTGYISGQKTEVICTASPSTV